MQILEDDYRLGFGNSFDKDLNTHSVLGHIYCYWFPQMPLTTIYLGCTAPRQEDNEII